MTKVHRINNVDEFMKLPNYIIQSMVEVGEAENLTRFQLDLVIDLPDTVVHEVKERFDPKNIAERSDRLAVEIAAFREANNV
jgi:hypothetical protein